MPILKLSLRAWRKQPASQFGAALISAALLLGVALLLCLEVSIHSAGSRLERENRFSIFLSPKVQAGDEGSLQDTIRHSLGAHADNDPTVRLVPMAETMQDLKEKHPELYSEIRDLGPEGELLVPRVMHVTASVDPTSIAGIVAQLKRISGVEAVDSTEARHLVLKPALLGFQWLIRILLFGVASAWVLGWIALARSHAASLAGVTDPFRLWGGSSWICRAPGMLAGLWVGIPSGLIAALAYAGLARPVLLRLAQSSAVFEVSTIPGMAGAVLLLVTGVVAGALSGALSGSATA